ncbi:MULTISPECIES: antibiotic biosynthesis monooxygenase family protein [Shouchella]|uniref:Antibiotic biosynthesis monooxygenase n=1 Tax=Shouchella hunanensis TaxID=766894 RepID=A0ABY7W3F1_9BACI|nr:MULTISPECIES: antibiotic biosynthesis monooxygenase family protein [Shouchella]WDF03198.1 antibiotic biosynthesis monooxygenase [Shouchella hunanensis]
MYVVHSTFKAPEDKAEEVIAIYRNRSKKVDSANGFVSFRLLQHHKRPGELTVELQFETKEDYLEWVRSQEFKDIHDLEKKYPDQELANIVPTVRQFEVIINE